jgi:hypothetical protein
MGSLRGSVGVSLEFLGEKHGNRADGLAGFSVYLRSPLPGRYLGQCKSI